MIHGHLNLKNQLARAYSKNEMVSCGRLLDMIMYIDNFRCRYRSITQKAFLILKRLSDISDAMTVLIRASMPTNCNQAKAHTAINESLEVPRCLPGYEIFLSS